jgi:fructoselysine-6-P-deglycase FrlB-like protein
MMDTFFTQYINLLDDDSAITQLLGDLKQQKAHIRTTLETQKTALKAVAETMRQQNRMLLLGMGFAHRINHLFALQLRRLGWYAIALPASEFLSNPLPVNEDFVMITCMSGETQEVIASLDYLKDNPIVSITGDDASTLAKKTQTNITISGSCGNTMGMLACMAYISAELQGVSSNRIYKMIDVTQDSLGPMHTAVELLHAKSTLLTIGSGLFGAVAQLFAHGAEQLSGKAIRSIEAEQLRYGLAEVLSPAVAVVYFRQRNESEKVMQDIRKLHELSSCTLIVIDSSGLTPLEGAITIGCPEGDDIYTALAVFEISQSLMIAYACGKNRRAGFLKYTEKSL